MPLVDARCELNSDDAIQDAQKRFFFGLAPMCTDKNSDKCDLIKRLGRAGRIYMLKVLVVVCFLWQGHPVTKLHTFVSFLLLSYFLRGRGC